VPTAAKVFTMACSSLMPGRKSRCVGERRRADDYMASREPRVRSTSTQSMVGTVKTPTETMGFSEGSTLGDIGQKARAYPPG